MTMAVTVCTVLVTCSAVRSKTGQISQAEADSLFEVAVRIIKKYETMHKPKDWPFVGYGHGVLPGEKFSRKRTLTEAEADALLRKDLRDNMAVFKKIRRRLAVAWCFSLQCWPRTRPAFVAGKETRCRKP